MFWLPRSVSTAEEICSSCSCQVFAWAVTLLLKVSSASKSTLYPILAVLFVRQVLAAIV